MSPRWLHWPAAASAGPDLTISGVTDASNGTDNDPVVLPADPDLVSLQVLASSRLIIRFVDITARNSFISAYPNGSSVSLVYDGTTFTYSSITWSTFDVQARLNAGDWDGSSFPSSTAAGDAYTFELTL